MRLIDADELRERFLARAKRAEDDSMPMTAAEMMLVARDIDRAPTVGDWINVQDRLPEKAGRYLTFRNPSCIRVTGFSLNLESVDQYEFHGMKRPGWYDYDSEYGYYEWRDITYWMPLPEPPKEVSGDA